jgi:hypothetical protein
MFEIYYVLYYIYIYMCIYIIRIYIYTYYKYIPRNHFTIASVQLWTWGKEHVAAVQHLERGQVVIGGANLCNKHTRPGKATKNEWKIHHFL